VKPKDETDGTPDWAKRMFKSVRKARWRLLVFLFFIGVPAFGTYRLGEAVTTGRVWHERSGRWITYSSDPGRFLLEIALWITAVIAPVLFLIARAKYPEWTQRFIDNMRLR
jgi:uncharacterized membrane protein